MCYDIWLFFDSQWTPVQLDYKATGSQFSNNRANTLGSQVNITASVRKTSGVQISRGEFTLYIPAFSSETGSNFFFYPAQLINVRNWGREGENRRGCRQERERERGSVKRKFKTTEGEKDLVWYIFNFFPYYSQAVTWCVMNLFSIHVVIHWTVCQQTLVQPDAVRDQLVVCLTSHSGSPVLNW